MEVEWMVTSWRSGRAERNTGISASVPEIRPRENHAINLHPGMRFQEFLGFGAAFTEASGSVLNRMPPDQAERVLKAFYSGEGLGYTWARVPIDSCDFSLSPYSAFQNGPDGPRIDETSFREHELTHILPWLEKARDLVRNRGGELRLLMVPWSPPAHMKSNGRRSGGGSLLPEFRRDWAEYLCRYVKTYEDRGFTVTFLGSQNEPNASQTWDSCLFTPAEERDFLENFLHPALEAQRLKDVGLSAWDHNREGLFERIHEVCSDSGKNVVKAAAFHWYSGDHFEALDLVRRNFPELLLLFTEGCIEYRHSDPDSQLSHAERYGRNIIGDLNHGTNLWMDWNLTLDSVGGPNYAGNYCDATILCDIESGGFEKRLSYSYLEHFCRFILPGSIRMGLSCYTERLPCTAWLRPDGAMAAVVMNPGEKDLPVCVRCRGEVIEMGIPANGIVSLSMHGNGKGL